MRKSLSPLPIEIHYQKKQNPIIEQKNIICKIDLLINNESVL